MHIKYIPQKLEDFIGNKDLKAFLSNMINKGEFRPIMFEGIYGSGKTTLAHIVSRSFGAPMFNIYDVNCVYYSGVDSMRERLDELRRSI